MDEGTNSLDNLNVVVTGGARGLGGTFALALSDQGCNVILCGRSMPALEVAAGHIHPSAQCDNRVDGD